MHPLLLKFELAGMPVRLGSYVALVFAGALAALLITLRRAREAGLPPRRLLPVFIAAVVLGFLGARLAFAMQYGGIPHRGGFVLYGGLISGMVAGLVAARAVGLPALRVADLASPGVLLAAAFGRVGCFLAGCCYGTIHEGGIASPAGSHAFRDQVRRELIDAAAPESLPLVPVVLFEAAALVILFVFVSALRRRSRAAGRVLGWSGLLYAAWRFIAEFWRGDHVPYWPGGLTFSQGVSLGVIAACGALLLREPRRPASTARFDLRPASALHFLALMASVGLSLGVSCASHGGSGGGTSSGVHHYRQPSGATPSASKHDDDKDDWFSDCMSDCISDCIDDCTDAACDKNCSNDSEEKGEGPSPAQAVLAELQPGTVYKGSLAVTAKVNDRLQADLRLDGTLKVDPSQADGLTVVHLKLKKVDLLIGDAAWQGSGDVDLQVHPLGDIRLLRSTLPAEFMGAMSALGKLTGNFLRGAGSEEPLEDLSRVVQEELGVPQPRAEFKMIATMGLFRRTMRGEANILKEPDGSHSLYWIVDR